MAGTEPHAWETGQMNSITYVGLDVHKATVSVAVAENGRGGEIRQLGVFENRPEVLSKLAARLSSSGSGCRASSTSWLRPADNKKASSQSEAASVRSRAGASSSAVVRRSLTSRGAAGWLDVARRWVTVVTVGSGSE